MIAKAIVLPVKGSNELPFNTYLVRQHSVYCCTAVDDEGICTQLVVYIVGIITSKSRAFQGAA